MVAKRGTKVMRRRGGKTVQRREMLLARQHQLGGGQGFRRVRRVSSATRQAWTPMKAMASASAHQMLTR